MSGSFGYKHKSGNQKRKEKEEKERAKAKLPKLDDYFVRRPPVAVVDENNNSSGSALRPAMPGPGAEAGLGETQNHNIRYVD